MALPALEKLNAHGPILLEEDLGGLGATLDVEICSTHCGVQVRP